MWMQLFLAMEINWTTYNIFLSILIKKKLSSPHSAFLAWLMFVTTQRMEQSKLTTFDNFSLSRFTK